MNIDNLKKLLNSTDSESRKIGQLYYESFQEDDDRKNLIAIDYANSLILDSRGKGIFEQMRIINTHVYDPSRIMNLIPNILKNE